MSGNIDKCPFCKSDRGSKTDEENVEQIMKRVEANDPASIYVLAGYYQEGRGGFQQDHSKAMELNVLAAELGFSLVLVRRISFLVMIVLRGAN